MSYVFFAGFPKDAPAHNVRDLFSQSGRVVSLRIANEKRGARGPARTASAADSLTMSGLIEFTDDVSARAAISTFNGYMIDTPRGQVRLRVGASQGYVRRRQRDESEEQQSYHLSDLSPSASDPLQQALRQVPAHELSEAVEQLRMLSVEHPERARALLDTFPQLRRATCLVMQKNGQLPGTLPPAAFVETAAEEEAQRERDAQAESEKRRAAATEEQIQSIINDLSPEALQELLVTDFENQPGLDDTVRANFLQIQRQLRAMAEEAAEEDDGGAAAAGAASGEADTS